MLSLHKYLAINSQPYLIMKHIIKGVKIVLGIILLLAVVNNLFQIDFLNQDIAYILGRLTFIALIGFLAVYLLRSA